ncbi:hypothetical protein [Streptomyces californicus]|uniref:hypothetical protein n=1 Tax=Streptomyces californicus TaxID=67351 RepID=UPI0033EAB1D4
MSTLTPAKPDAARVPGAPARAVLRGPTRVLLRLHRRVLWGAGAVSLAGLVLRRTVPAMAASLLVSGAVTAVLSTLRPTFWPVERDVFTPNSRYVWPEQADVTEQGLLTSGGDRLPPDLCSDPTFDLDACFAEHGVTHHYLEYHPASHYWPLQLVETGVLLALGALALYAAFRVLRRLHG